MKSKNKAAKNNKDKHEPDPKSRDVASTTKDEFMQKRDEWIQCLVGKDRNSVDQQVSWMTWNFAVYEVINESRRLAPAASDGGVELNDMIHSFIDSCFFESLSIAIRRLTDQKGLRGKYGVFSLTSLIEDMKKHVHLLTRENLFFAEGLPTDPKPIKKRHDENVRQKIREGARSWYLPQELDYNRIVERHSTIDKLCGVTEESRSPDDTVMMKWFDAMLDKLVACKKIATNVDKFIAHAATPYSRATVNADNTRITLRDLRRAHEVFCCTINFLDVYLLTRYSHCFLAHSILDQFEYIDRPIVTSENVEHLRVTWQRFEEKMQEWENDNNLDWCLRETVQEDSEL